MAHPKHAAVRARYQFRCGYCSVTEIETGGELTIDHHRPTSAGGDDSDDNLVYCCFRCNTFKADFHPSPADVLAGFRILHPLLNDPAAHLRLNAQLGMLESLTETGRFQIALLHLNRPQLVEMRLARRLRELIAESCRLLAEENESLRVRIIVMEQYAAELRRRLSGEANNGAD